MFVRCDTAKKRLRNEHKPLIFDYEKIKKFGKTRGNINIDEILTNF